MEWFAKGTDVLTDPRTWKFAEALGVSVPTAAGHLDGVYGLLAKHGDEHGRLDTVPDGMLEHVALWAGTPGRFAAVFRRLYQDPDGTLHRWREWNGAAIGHVRKGREKKRRQRDERRAKAMEDGDSPREAPQDKVGDGPGDRREYLTGPDLTGPDQLLSLPTTLPATRKKRESRPKGDAANTNWLAPIGAAWEARYDRGSFPYGQAARECKALRDAGHTPEEIARRLAWYLENRGSETVLSPDQLARRHFTPNLRDFRLRFGQFDPSAEEAA